MTYLRQLFLALDFALNAFLGGQADETLCSRAYRSTGLWVYFRSFVDSVCLCFGFPDHCHKSYVAGALRRATPPEQR